MEEAEQFLQADVLLQLAESAPRLAGAHGCLSGWSLAVHGVSRPLPQLTATGQTAAGLHSSIRQESRRGSRHRIAKIQASWCPAAAAWCGGCIGRWTPSPVSLLHVPWGRRQHTCSLLSFRQPQKDCLMCAYCRQVEPALPSQLPAGSDSLHSALHAVAFGRLGLLVPAADQDGRNAAGQLQVGLTACRVCLTLACAPQP